MAKQNHSAGRYRYEYVKHLQKNAFPILLYLIAFVIVSAAVTLCAAAIINPLTKNCTSVKECNYDYAIESQNKSHDYRQNYRLENLVTFLNDNKRINVNTYLCSDDNNGIINFNDFLKPDEVAISKQIADRLRVGVGDQLQVALPIYDTPSTYHIKVIFPYVSDYYKIDDNKDFAVAFLGYDEKLESNTRGKYIYFLTGGEFEDFTHLSLDYDQKYFVQGELEALARKSYFYTAVILCIMFSFACAYHIIISKFIKREVIKYSKDGFSLNVVKGFYKADHVIYSVFPLLFISILANLLKLSPYCEVGYICISVVWIIWWLIGGKCFEKAA
ncbi:MAG: hypothetical protein J6B01_12240 [Ruminococcus sp.]|nr:hypothetical protein [Ruminococcus sp.]